MIAVAYLEKILFALSIINIRQEYPLIYYDGRLCMALLYFLYLRRLSLYDPFISLQTAARELCTSRFDVPGSIVFKEFPMLNWLPMLLLALAYALVVILEWRKGRRLEKHDPRACTPQKGIPQ